MSPADKELLGRIIARGERGRGIRLTATETRLVADAARTPRKPREDGLC